MPSFFHIVMLHSGICYIPTCLKRVKSKWQLHPSATNIIDFQDNTTPRLVALQGHKCKCSQHFTARRCASLSAPHRSLFSAPCSWMKRSVLRKRAKICSKSFDATPAFHSRFFRFFTDFCCCFSGECGMILCASPTVERFEMFSAVILPGAKFNYIKRHFSLTAFLGCMNHGSENRKIDPRCQH